MSIPLQNIKHFHQLDRLSSADCKWVAYELLKTIKGHEEWSGLETDEILQLHVERLLKIRRLVGKKPDGSKG